MSAVNRERSEPDQALYEVVESLRDPETVITPHLCEPTVRPVLGKLAASGPRSARAPGEYGAVVESVLEGYLLHHGIPRLMAGHDGDLALLAGDYLYALGLERLARLDDTPAVEQLSDLISLAAESRAEGLDSCLDALWLAGTVAVACGASPEIKAAKQALHGRDSGAEQALLEAAEITAERSGMGSAFGATKNAIDFPAVEGSSLD